MAARWRALRDSLAEQGADTATLDAMEAVAGRHTEVPGPHGQVIVGAGGELRLDTVLPAPPRREIARWAPLPHLMPMVAQLGPVVPYVLAVVDRTCGHRLMRALRALKPRVQALALDRPATLTLALSAVQLAGLSTDGWCRGGSQRGLRPGRC